VNRRGRMSDGFSRHSPILFTCVSLAPVAPGISGVGHNVNYNARLPFSSRYQLGRVIYLRVSSIDDLTRPRELALVRAWGAVQASDRINRSCSAIVELPFNGLFRIDAEYCRQSMAAHARRHIDERTHRNTASQRGKSVLTVRPIQRYFFNQLPGVLIARNRKEEYARPFFNFS